MKQMEVDSLLVAEYQLKTKNMIIIVSFLKKLTFKKKSYIQVWKRDT